MGDMNLIANSDGKTSSSSFILEAMDLTSDSDLDIMLLYPDLSSYVRLESKIRGMIRLTKVKSHI